MFKYEFTDVQLNSLITFLARVTDYKDGLMDVQRMNEIMNILQNPLKDEVKE
ncbi:hypothetical protein [Paenibacillus elgii]|uniref:hypothetical protein n=1 Tax=Paenibacillus elgii TaxID=189691 RepID=UPI002040F64D|nr:hypothetical protein [Paenibacillus elgii]MCM3274163.1 hypothetical protein [Paenibacillus elgii]